jgi:hypothetical protein
MRPALFTIVAVVLYAAVVAHRFAAKPSACTTADEADVTGLDQQAVTRYAAVLDGDAGEQCAQTGLLRAVSERCTSVGILAAEGGAREARKTYMSILALDLPVAEDALLARRRQHPAAVDRPRHDRRDRRQAPGRVRLRAHLAGRHRRLPTMGRGGRRPSLSPSTSRARST